MSLECKTGDLESRFLEEQAEFVALLVKLTRRGVVEWARGESEPSEVCCLVGDEYIQFELRSGATGDIVTQLDEPPHAAVGKCRNVTMLWLPGVCHCEQLLALLEQAPVSDEEIGRLRREGYSAPVRALRGLFEGS